MNRRLADRNKLVADADAGVITGPPGGDAGSHDRGLAVGLVDADPGNTIVMERIIAQVLKAEDGRDDHGYGQQQQQGTSELATRFAHRTPLLTNCLPGTLHLHWKN